MTAAEVRESLTLRWPDSEYLAIEEAPEDSSRQGRKIDLLVVSLWRSRGLKLDAVEVKVSYSDWARERDRAAKADFWWRHSHRFWVAVPAELVDRIKPELPDTWGLLACKVGEKPKVVVKASRHDAEPLPWSTTVGVLRAAADSGVNALSRANAKGYSEGRRAGMEEAERRTQDGFHKAAHETLLEKVHAFRDASGIDLARAFSTEEAERLGVFAGLIQDRWDSPVHTIERIGRLANGLERTAAEARTRAKEIREVVDELTAPRSNGKEGQCM